MFLLLVRIKTVNPPKDQGLENPGKIVPNQPTRPQIKRGERLELRRRKGRKSDFITDQ